MTSLASRAATATSGVPIPLVAPAAVALAVLTAGPNFDLAALSVAVLAGGCLLLWRAGESSVMLVFFCLHWAGASVAVFHANWLGIPVQDYTPLLHGDMRAAVGLTLVGLLCLAAGMRLGAGGWRPREGDAARSVALGHPLHRWFRLYCAAWCLSFVVSTVAYVVPGLAQVMLATAGLKWAFFFALAYATFASQSFRAPYLLLAFCAEVVSSLGGYFSAFHSVFLVSFCAALAASLRLSLRSQALLGLLAALLLLFSVCWTVVKPEYRNFVSEGEHQQVIKVEYSAQLDELGILVGRLDGDALADGLNRLLHRVSYVEYFAVALQYVPDYLPHEGGALLGDAILRPLMPRALFPDKEAIDDTARTNLYTDGAAGQSDGTSISLGYVAEAYIDFGAYGMMAALLALGWAYGLVYRSLTRWRGGGLMGMGAATAVLVNLGMLDSSVTKVWGFVAVSYLAAWLLLRVVLPQYAAWTAEGRRR